MSYTAKVLGQKIRAVRRKKLLSQVELADSLGVDKAYISRLESGGKNPTLLTIERIAGALGVSVKYLFD